MLDRIRAIFAREGRSLAAPSEEILRIFGVPADGAYLSAEAALRVPAVACAVRILAEAVATLPIKLYRQGDQEPAFDHPAYTLLHDDASDWCSAYDLKLAVTIDALTNDKGGFAYVNRLAGRPVELLRLDPAAVTVTTGAGGEPSYVLAEAGGPRELDRRDVIHIRAFGHVDRCPLSLAREAIATAAAQDRHARRLFTRGGRPSGVLKVPGKLAPDAVRRIRDSWHAAHSGEESGRTAVLEGGAEFSPLTFSAVDLQFVEARTFQILEIARAFRVPPHMLYELGRATWSNTSEMGQDFLTYSLLPWLEVWTGAIRRTLLTPEERATMKVEFITDDLVRADLAARMNAYSVAIAARILNPNEVRAMENRAPYDGGEAFVNPNTTSGGSPNAA
ncbi:phage portal protein [Oharaeibacter diazotrophicus]|nr:phage portal protein [Oharaeibacter diazotrophicus]